MKLYFDALTFLSAKFWKARASKVSPFDEIRAMRREVARFVEAVHASDFELTAVVPLSSARPVLGPRRAVLGLDALYAEALWDCGAEVLRPSGDEAADVLAALAVENGAAVLSKNHDMPRLCPRVAADFEIEGGRLRASFEDVSPAAATATRRSGSRPCIASLNRRGASSSSDRTCGNLHAQCRQLRAAVYARMGKFAVLEELPEWVDGRLVWTRTVVAADDALAPALDDPHTTLAALLHLVAQHGPIVPVLTGWRLRERLFNVVVMAAELHVAVCGGRVTDAVFCLETCVRCRDASMAAAFVAGSDFSASWIETHRSTVCLSSDS